MKRAYGYIAALTCVFFILPLLSTAQTATELQQQIDNNSAQIAQLNAEIAQYQKQLDTTTQQKNTLQNTVNQLTLQSKQLTAKINVTKSQIKTTQLQIQQLAGSISTTQESIDIEHAGLAESLRHIAEVDAQPMALLVFTAEGITSAWEDVSALNYLAEAVNTHTALLADKKQTLTDTKTAAEEKRAQLLKQQQTLAAQQGSLNATKKAQSELLAQTKNQEASYQSIISQKQSERASFEKALFELASQLEYTLDPTKVPPPSSGILRWPLDNVFVTQNFGKTSSSGRLYTSGTHDGIDLRAPLGTPVRSALSGVVVEINQGAVPNCQYGKWVLIKHANGLSTLYAHLSDIRVGKGNVVATGQIIGYSGNTGYATGPHLHFTVYASDAVNFKNYSCKSGRATLIPIANPSAYLNPMSYLSAN